MFPLRETSFEGEMALVPSAANKMVESLYDIKALKTLLPTDRVRDFRKPIPAYRGRRLW